MVEGHLHVDPSGNSITDDIKGFIRLFADIFIQNPIAVAFTQDENYDFFFDLGGFIRDKNGVLHARQDCLQQYGGYNWSYDVVFDFATYMRTDHFDFQMDGVDYRFWCWKGDYLNMGSGAELGIYRRYSFRGIKTDHYVVDQSLALPMTISLKNKNKTLFYYAPKENHWWITGFNPYYLNPNPDDLTATYTIDFSGNKRMYHSFQKAIHERAMEEGIKSSWKFHKKTYKASYSF